MMTLRPVSDALSDNKTNAHIYVLFLTGDGLIVHKMLFSQNLLPLEGGG